MVEFITSSWNHRVASAISTACVFVTSLSNGANKSQVPQILAHLLPWVVGLLYQLQGMSLPKSKGRTAAVSYDPVSELLT